MRIHLDLGRRISVVVLGLLLAAPALAVDLTSIPREIGKLPKLTSPQPLYCLLVFGPEAKTRVWLVRDGDVLYVDRNANGDLTEPGERFEPEAKTSRPADGILNFRIGDIADGEQLHKALGVSWFNVDHLKDHDPRVTQRLKQDPKYRATSMACDIDMPGQRGNGIDGRVRQTALLGDDEGLLEFATDPKQAPILHFGGPWQVKLAGKGSLRIGREQEVYLVFGTPGLGPGTMTDVAYQGVVPAELHPQVRVTFPTAGGKTITREYTFTRRCCGVNLYGGVDVPDNVSLGQAEVEISLASWNDLNVAPSSYRMKLLPPISGPKLKPVSARLKSKLEHQDPKGSITNIRFSPDGMRLIAGDYPGGVVHVWDMVSGSRLVTINSGEGGRASSGTFEISPDWQRIYTATNNRGKFERIEREGKPLNRVTYSDAIHVWDASTGEQLHTWQQDPARGILYIKLSPDGKHLTVQEETPGEFSDVRPRATTVLHTSTFKHRQLFDTHAWACCFSEDSKLLAIFIPLPGEHSYHESIGFFSGPDWKETSRAPLGPLERAYVGGFAKGGQIAYGHADILPKRDDYQNAMHELRIWEVATGKDLLAIRSESSKETVLPSAVSPDGKTLAAYRIDRDAGRSRLLLINLDNWSIREIECEDRTYIRGFAFHPDSTWLAVSELTLPEGKLPRDPPLEMFEQPRIRFHDLASGKLLETIVAPQAFQMSIALSPDAKTLATAGQGAVLLWDMTTPPGELPTPPEIGQTVELAGTKVDGTPLDAADYRGKVTLVSFWATWCQPCVAEMPELKSIYQELHDRGFEVLGVSLDEPDVDLAAFAKNQDLPWTVLRGASADSSGEKLPLARRLGVTSVPRSFLLDREGKIVAIDPKLHELEKLTVPMLDANAK